MRRCAAPTAPTPTPTLAAGGGGRSGRCPRPWRAGDSGACGAGRARCAGARSPAHALHADDRRGRSPCAARRATRRTRRCTIERRAQFHRRVGAVCPTDVLFGRLQWGLTWLALALPAFPSIRCLRVSTSPPHVVPSGSGKNEITLLPPTHRTARVLKYRGVEVREVLVFDRSERCRFVSPPPQPPPREVVAVACLMI